MGSCVSAPTESQIPTHQKDAGTTNEQKKGPAVETIQNKGKKLLSENVVVAKQSQEKKKVVEDTEETEEEFKSSSDQHLSPKQQKPSVKRGYSSGASTEAEDVSGRTTPHRKGHHSRETSSDAVGLGEIINQLKIDGSFSETVVRIETPFGLPIEDVYDGVHDGMILGSGVSGIVRKVHHKKSKVDYAVKCLDLGLIKNDAALKQLRDEILIMCQLDHPNIVRLEEVYESETEIYLVQELCEGGDLFDRLDEQPDYHYTEAQCARLVKQMLSALRYLHSKKIIHRDLKLENFLFSSASADSELRMIDFGLSKHFQLGEVQHEAVGTPYTVAPEVIRGSYDERCDLWALGVITYLILSGEAPFGGCYEGDDNKEVRDKILRGEYRFEPEDIWQNVSDKAKDFIKMLLLVDYSKRPRAKQTQKHPWLQDLSERNGNGNGNNQLNPKVVNALISFKEYSDMRKLLCEVLSFTLLPEQISDLRNEFEILDSGDGEISLSALKQVLLKNAGAGSLGSLTEKEVEDIFNALRFSKTEQTIRWHEFIAAGISACQYDERNLQLAFDRIDSDHKGYISFQNILDLMGCSDGCQTEDDLRKMWMKTMSDCHKYDVDRITYDDFLLLMKGQTMDPLSPPVSPRVTAGKRTPVLTPVELPLVAVPELSISSPGNSEYDIPSLDDQAGGKVERKLVLHGSISSDSDEDSETFGSRPIAQNIMVPLPEIPGFYKKRSRSMEHAKAPDWSEEIDRRDGLLVKPDSSRAVILPGRLPSTRHHAAVENVIMDDAASPLVVHKTLYRTHREMRSAVLAAAKRFEEKKAKREIGAGLVVRRGSLQYAAEESKQYRQKLMIKKAKVRTGRSRRQKVASDLTGMM